MPNNSPIITTGHPEWGLFYAPWFYATNRSSLRDYNKLRSSVLIVIFVGHYLLKI